MSVVPRVSIIILLTLNLWCIEVCTVSDRYLARVLLSCSTLIVVSVFFAKDELVEYLRNEKKKETKDP